jgi:Tfp pilus assembly protein PilN
MYLFAWWVIIQAMTDVVTSSLIVNRETPPINREIQELNRLTRNTNLSSQDYAQLSPILFDLISILPNNIKLVAVDIDRQRNSISFSGTASTRDALINFQKIISEVSWLNGASAPTSQLFQKENISFEIRGTLKGFAPLKKN